MSSSKMRIRCSCFSTPCRSVMSSSKDVILLGRDSKITYEEVHSVLKLKEFQKSAGKTTDPAAESLSVKAASKRPFKNKKAASDKGKSHPQKETRSFHWCKKPGHLKKNCYAWKRKQAEAEKPIDTTR